MYHNLIFSVLLLECVMFFQFSKQIFTGFAVFQQQTDLCLGTWLMISLTQEKKNC